MIRWHVLQSRTFPQGIGAQPIDRLLRGSPVHGGELGTVLVDVVAIKGISSGQLRSGSVKF
jgi:hypothetical protein